MDGAKPRAAGMRLVQSWKCAVGMARVTPRGRGRWRERAVQEVGGSVGPHGRGTRAKRQVRASATHRRMAGRALAAAHAALFLGALFAVVPSGWPAVVSLVTANALGAFACGVTCIGGAALFVTVRAMAIAVACSGAVARAAPHTYRAVWRQRWAGAILILTILCWWRQMPALVTQLASRKLIIILLYIGCVERNPGPPEPDDGKRRMKIGTLNAPGLHVLRRSRVGKVEEEGFGDPSEEEGQ